MRDLRCKAKRSAWIVFAQSGFAQTNRNVEEQCFQTPLESVRPFMVAIPGQIPAQKAKTNRVQPMASIIAELSIESRRVRDLRLDLPIIDGNADAKPVGIRDRHDSLWIAEPAAYAVNVDLQLRSGAGFIEMRIQELDQLGTGARPSLYRQRDQQGALAARECDDAPSLTNLTR